MTGTRFVAEVASSQRSGVTAGMEQSWWTDSSFYFGTDIHAPRLGTEEGRGLQHFEWVLPSCCCNGWIFGWVNTYGKMEAGAEASPQQHPRRKPVLHCLEDQKRVSAWLIHSKGESSPSSLCCVVWDDIKAVWAQWGPVEDRWMHGIFCCLIWKQGRLLLCEL